MTDQTEDWTVEKNMETERFSAIKKLLTVVVGCLFVFFIICSGILLQGTFEAAFDARAQINASEEATEPILSEASDWAAQISAFSQYEEYFKDYILEHNYKIFPRMAEIIVDGVYQASREYKISPLILMALMDVESDFDYVAQSDRNAVGLLQIHLPTWVLNSNNPLNLKKVGIIQGATDLYDPYKNLRAGAFILSHYMKEAKRRGVRDVVSYSITRYEGGKKNDHVKRVKNAMGDYLLYYQKHQMAALERASANN